MKTIWIIDSERWPRALLRAELIERGFDAVGYVCVADASPTVRERFPDAIVVDLRDVDRAEVAQLFQLGVPVIGIASTPAAPWLSDFQWSRLFHRPVALGEIADAVS